MRSIRPVQKVIDAFESLPGIGPKSAARLAYYLLNLPEERLNKFAQALSNLKKETNLCQICFNVGEGNLCEICADDGRDKSQICVVENALDLLAIEKTDSYRGVYHVLGGVINPLANIGPNEIFIPSLLARIKKGGVSEVIFATNPNMEGEASAMYITNRIREMDIGGDLKITRIGRGLPTGADVEYADGQTLVRAMEGRSEM